MLWTILVVLLVLWLFGFLGGFVTTNLIHLLLVVALVVLVINVLSRGALHKQVAKSPNREGVRERGVSDQEGLRLGNLQNRARKTEQRFRLIIVNVEDRQ